MVKRVPAFPIDFIEELKHMYVDIRTPLRIRKITTTILQRLNSENEDKLRRILRYVHNYKKRTIVEARP